MSSLHHETILETIFEEVLAEYYNMFNAGEISQDELERICYQRFEDMCH